MRISEEEYQRRSKLLDEMEEEIAKMREGLEEARKPVKPWKFIAFDKAKYDALPDDSAEKKVINAFLNGQEITGIACHLS